MTRLGWGRVRASRSEWRLLVAGAVLSASQQALGQATAPSSITPSTLRPPPGRADTGTALPPIERLVPPPGADQLTVAPSAIVVEGGFSDMAAITDAITAPYRGQRTTLAQIYTAASAIEAAYIRRGYVLARLTVPPQTLRDGGPVRVVVIDGFVEDIDVSGVPSRVRGAVANRVASVMARPRLKLSQIEQPLVLAAAIPGLTITSTLARGDKPGGAKLLIAGRQSAVSGSIAVDNRLARSLGGYGVTAQVAWNSPLGLGEQIYGFAVSGYDPVKAFRSDAPVRVVGGGIVLPSTDGRYFVNPEATFSKTQPQATPGVPRTRGQLRRITLRAGYTISKLRSRGTAVTATIEHITESNDAIDFATRLSLDRFTVARLQANFSTALARGGGIAAMIQLSQSLRGTDVRGPLAIAPSRQGAGPRFTKLEAALQGAVPIGRGMQARVAVKGQISFGKPLFRSEQGSLEGQDALSAYIGGITAVDENIVGRFELSRPVALATPLQVVPYAFAAAGYGRIYRPTAVEQSTLALANLGAGIRGSIAQTGLTFDIEYARGLSRNPNYKLGRLSVSVAKSF